MSGIAGIIRLDGAPAGLAEIAAMVERMRQRGPDRQRASTYGQAAFGQALLATTPEAGAESQPWVHPDTGCVVVSDSRLDERPALLHALRMDERHADEIGDAALLHAAYHRWGVACAERLLGDFAFALWDPRRRLLVCARDPMGVRPLYYYHAPRQLFVLASETQSLLTLPQVPTDLDEGRIADALVGELEGIDNTSTFYEAILRLAPASTLVLQDGHLQVSRHWSPLSRAPSPFPKSEAEWIEAVHDKLATAVRRRLRTSVRVGSMLSGGLDSSSVVALASRMPDADGRGPLPTFSAINSRGECPETSAVRSMLDAFEVDATTVDVQALDDVVPALLACLDRLAEPFDGSMLLIDAQYQAAAHRGVRCLMDGMPGDNLFSTTGRLQQLFHHGRWFDAYRCAVASHREARNPIPRLRAMLTMLGACMPTPIRQIREAGRDRRHLQEEFLDASLIGEAFAHRIGLSRRYRRYTENITENALWDASGRACCVMTAAYIAAAVDRYGRAAAPFGVEPRHPFLDRDVIQCHTWLPIELRGREGWPKWALRMAMHDALPNDIAWRRGKEHLGLKFNAAVVGPRLGEALSLPASGHRLANYVDAEKATAALKAWRTTRDEKAFNALLSAELLHRWLEQQADSASLPLTEHCVDLSHGFELPVHGCRATTRLDSPFPP